MWYVMLNVYNNNNNNKMRLVTHQLPSKRNNWKGVGRQSNIHVHRDLHTVRRRGKKQWLAHIRFTSLRNWTAEKSTSEIRISLGLTYTLMAKWQWKRIPVEGSCEWNSLLVSSCQLGMWDFEGQEQERRVLKGCTAAGSYWVRYVAAVWLI